MFNFICHIISSYTYNELLLIRGFKHLYFNNLTPSIFISGLNSPFLKLFSMCSENYGSSLCLIESLNSKKILKYEDAEFLKLSYKISEFIILS